MEDTSQHESWKDWFRQHGPKLLLFARQATRTRADAEDVVQEAFVRFWKHQRKLGGEPLGLLFASVRRASVDLARRNLRRAQRELTAESEPGECDGGLFEALCENDDRRVAMEAAIGQLPDKLREVLVLKIWGERTFEEIGTQLGLSTNTAASRYRYALTALRELLITAKCPLP
jgi:RNA polymerase sigma-70 factor (ECF subfamily)